jgi:hypothetical protein
MSTSSLSSDCLGKIELGIAKSAAVDGYAHCAQLLEVGRLAKMNSSLTSEAPGFLPDMEGDGSMDLTKPSLHSQMAVGCRVEVTGWTERPRAPPFFGKAYNMKGQRCRLS